MANKDFKNTDSTSVKSKRSNNRGRGRKRGKEASNGRANVANSGATNNSANPAQSAYMGLATMLASDMSYKRAVGAPLKGRGHAMFLKDSEGYLMTDMSVPGIMTINVLPTFGVSVDQYSPLNKVTQMWYDAINAFNNRTQTYNGTSVMNYIISVNSLVQIYTWLVRMYGTFTKYMMFNEYTPKILLQAQKLNPKYDWAGARRQMSAHMLEWASIINSSYLPKLVATDAMAATFENIYTDSPNIEVSQWYMYCPIGFHKYDWKTDTVKFVALPEEFKSYNDLYDYVADFFNCIQHFSLKTTMRSDLDKAFNGEFYRLPEVYTGILPDYTTTLIYDEGFLATLKNMVLIGDHNQVVSKSLDYTINHWDPNNPNTSEFITFKPIVIDDNVPGVTATSKHPLERAQYTYMTELHPFNNDYYLSFNQPVVTDLDIAIATDVMPVVDIEYAPEHRMFKKVVKSCGRLLCFDAYVYSLEHVDVTIEDEKLPNQILTQMIQYAYSVPASKIRITGGAADYHNIMNTSVVLDAFAVKMPYTTAYLETSTTGNVNLELRENRDWETYSTISKDKLQQIQEARTKANFGIGLR